MCVCVHSLFVSGNFLDPPHPWWFPYSMHETCSLILLFLFICFLLDIFFPSGLWSRFVPTPNFLILFSIFSILLCSFPISIVSVLFCRSTSRLLSFSLIFFVYSLHLSSIIAFLVGSLQASQNHTTYSASLLARNCKMHQLYSYIWCSTISDTCHSICEYLIASITN